MFISLKYRLYNSLGIGTWIIPNQNEYDSRINQIEFEFKHNDYQDIESSDTVGTIGISGDFSTFVLNWLVLDAQSATNCIEVKLTYNDDNCVYDFRDSCYIRKKNIKEVDLKGELTFKECLEVSLKFDRTLTKKMSIFTIDGDRRMGYENAWLVDFATPPVGDEHADIRYISLDGLSGYKNLLWANVFIGFLLTGVLGAIIASLAANIITTPAAIALTASSVILTGLAITAVLVPDYLGERGAQNVIISPKIKTYIKNICLSNGINLAIDEVFTNPIKLDTTSYSLKDACFAFTKGIIHDNNREYVKTNMSVRDFLEWVTKNFNAKWRLIGNNFHLRYKENDYYQPIINLTNEPFTFQVEQELPIAACSYEYSSDGSEQEGDKRLVINNDIVSFTDNQATPTQKGIEYKGFIPSVPAFRFDGIADPVERVDNLFTNPAVIGLAGIYAPFFVIGNSFAIGNNDNYYLMAASRFFTKPKLVVVQPNDNSRSIELPLTNFIPILEKKGMNMVDMTQPNRRFYNYIVPCDENLNAIQANTFSLQNDDPRVTQKEGIRKYKQVQLCCDRLKELGLLYAPNTTPDIAIDFYALIRNFDGTEDNGEIRRIKFNFQTSIIELDIQRVLKNI